jgi:hypothetical protein
MKHLAYAASALAVMLLAGCATSRSELKVTAPVVQPTAMPADGAPSVRIRSVVDARIFEEKPADPSTPSLGFGGAEAASADIKDRAIGRKRNTYGQALGDILLEPGQSVASLLEGALTAAFHDAGYRVVDSNGAEGIPVDVRITRFWSWFQPGFWAIQLHSQIATELRFDEAAPILVESGANDSRQMATDKAWLEIIEAGLTNYRGAAARAMPPARSSAASASP